jgi:Flp pilus assembly protein TadG
MVVLPVVVAVALGLVWVLALAVGQVRVVDAAREAARAAARGESDSAAREAGARVAPSGARISIRRGGGLVTAQVRVHVPGPGGVFRLLPGVPLSAGASAVEEPR